MGLNCRLGMKYSRKKEGILFDTKTDNPTNESND